jgi:hypothetical protein
MVQTQDNTVRGRQAGFVGRFAFVASLVVGLVIGLSALSQTRPSDRAVAGAAATTTTVVATSSTAVPTTTVLADSPLFVSADYPRTARPGTTIRLTVTCTRPLRDGDNPSIFVTAVDNLVEGFTALSADATYEGNGMFVDWLIPNDQAAGEYVAEFFCDGRSDTFDPGVEFPPGIGSGQLPMQIVSPSEPGGGLPETD